MAVKMIIDTDPGIDDAMAIFYAAAAPDIELLGLTTIFGNVHTHQATRNALRLVEAVGLNIPVCEGLATPRVLPPFTPSAYVHGDEGFGTIPAAIPDGEKDTRSAVEFLVEQARLHKGELVLCPIGPLTNIAAAIDADPEFATNCARIVLMGGSLSGGNVTEWAEANTYHDPHAAEVVFNSGADVVMVGLDVTDKIQCTLRDFEAVAESAPDLGGMLLEMTRFYIDFYMSVGKHFGCSLHDPAAVIACTHPQLFATQGHSLTVSCSGETSGEVRSQGAGRVQVCTGEAHPGAFAEIRSLFLETLATLP